MVQRPVDRAESVVTPERFGRGMTFDQYVSYTGTPENLARQAGWWLGTERRDFSGLLRAWWRARSRSHAREGPRVAAIRVHSAPEARILDERAHGNISAS